MHQWFGVTKNNKIRENYIIVRDEASKGAHEGINLDGKAVIRLDRGEWVRISTPGYGGWLVEEGRDGNEGSGI
jgi:hypothetical protein